MESLSIEETNRIRVSLGLRPIPTENHSTNHGSRPTRVEGAEVCGRAVERPDSSGAVERTRGHDLQVAKLVAESDESTVEWLARMRRIKEQRAAERTGADMGAAKLTEARNRSARVAEISETPQTAEPVGHAEPALSAASSDTGADRDEPVEGSGGAAAPEFDPLDYDVEFDREESRRSDYKKARIPRIRVQKPKGKKRQRLAQSEYELRAVDLPEEDELYDVLSENRRKLTAASTAGITTAAQPYVSEEPAGGLVVSDTLDFLNAVKQRASEVRAAPETQTEAAKQDASAQTGEVAVEPTADSAPPRAPSEPAALVSTSVADTLRLLRQKGPVDRGGTAEERPLQSRPRPRREWARRVAAERLARQVALREQQETLSRLPAHERREIAGLLEQQTALEEAQAAERQFADYTPAVQLVHYGADGRPLDPKEAYKELSRKFHGTAEGKRRAERRRRKFEQQQSEQKQTRLL